MTRTITNVHRGEVHKWSLSLIPTTREAPADADTASHVLLHRAGFIRQVGAGIFDYLPLGWRVINRISTIIREELSAAGCTELLMPALEPFELFAGTRRDVDYGDNLFRVKDRKGRLNALAPTHEEVITELMRTSITSYKQLPLNLYQIQTKFRDEPRPRAGILRGREFLMKDAYSFHTSVDGPGGLNTAYDAMYAAYTRIFTRCGLDFTAVEAESGPIGGSASHEFMVNCAAGEDTILKCPASGYAANVEKCEIGPRPWSFDGAPGGAIETVHTPNLPGIDEVAGVLKVKPEQMLKCLLFVNATDVGSEGVKRAREKWEQETTRLNTAVAAASREVRESPEKFSSHEHVSPETLHAIESRVAEARESFRKALTGCRWFLAIVRGDHEVNEGKLKAVAGGPVAMADETSAAVLGFAVGYISPRSIQLCNATLVVDPDAACGGTAWATGADAKDHHVRQFNWGREMGGTLSDASRVKVADIRNAKVGDPSPRAAGQTLVAGRGIEVGHVFKLGTKYSDAMGFSVLDASQKRQSVIMGCYGIGVSRTMAACVEMSHDADGIVWPSALAPYHVLITVMKPDSEAQKKVAADLAEKLSAAGADVLIDDRDERPGVKFKDADLIGIPLRLTIGDKALEQNSVELKRRKDGAAVKAELVPIPSIFERAIGML